MLPQSTEIKSFFTPIHPSPPSSTLNSSLIPYSGNEAIGPRARPVTLLPTPRVIYSSSDCLTNNRVLSTFALNITKSYEPKIIYPLTLTCAGQPRPQWGIAHRPVPRAHKPTRWHAPCARVSYADMPRGRAGVLSALRDVGRTRVPSALGCPTHIGVPHTNIPPCMLACFVR